jgi:membrane fusion protein, multidrug efflux system
MNHGFVGPAFLIISATLLAAAAPDASGSAKNSEGPSVLVVLTRLQQGSLPRVVSVYGRVEASAATRQTVMAPATAVVDAIFVKPGEEVAAGAPLIRLGPSPGTAAAYEKALSDLNAARELVRRTQTLLGQHLATRQQLADAEKSASDAKTSLTALKAEGAGKPQTLSAPFDGIVTGVSTSPGAIVNQGAALLDLARANGLVLRAGVVPEQAAEIHSGDPANITLLGGRDAGTGTVLLRGSMVDAGTGLVPVDIALPQGSFIPGQMAQAGIITGKVQGYVVPHEAVLVNDNGVPYVVQATDMIAHEVPVRILLSAGAKDVVSGALNPAAPLVLAGNYQLHDGMKVRVADPNEPANK